MNRKKGRTELGAKLKVSYAGAILYGKSFISMEAFAALLIFFSI